MRRILPFLCAVLLGMMLWTGTAAHAAEALSCAEVSASAAGHFEGDTDQVPSDDRDASPHHHSLCHGHCVGISPEMGALSSSDAVSRPAPAPAVIGISQSRLGSALRPPIA